MSTDIDDLSCDASLGLYYRFIARLKHLDAAETLNAMIKLNVGAKVCFEAGKHGKKGGILIKFNQKTTTVLTDDAVAVGKYRHNCCHHSLKKPATKQRSST